MAARRKPPSRRPVTDQDLVTLALTRFGDSGLRDVRDIAKQAGRNPAVVVRAIAAAVRKGLVEVRPRRGVGPESQLEGRLVEDFDLLGARVVSVANRENLSSGEYDDRVQDAVGRGLAEALASGPVFFDGCSAGIGSGRAVHSAVESLQEARLRARDVSVASLSGNLMPEAPSRTTNIRYDADWNASVFAQAFVAPVDLYLMSNNLVAKTAEKAAEARSDQWPGKFQPGPQGFSHLICGVGVFEPGHRLFDGATAEAMEPIREQLLDLQQLVKTAASKFPDHYPGSPVADLSNHLFVARPLDPPIPEELAGLLARIEGIVGAVNRFLVAAPDVFLQQARTVMLAAGVPRKGQALLHLLRKNNVCRVRYLCTDLATAEWLVQAIDREEKIS